MGNKEKQVWLAFCYWDQPYLIENQQVLLGVFSTQAKAEERLRRHEEYAAQSDHAFVDCSTVCYAVTVDDAEFTDPHTTAGL